VKAAEARIEIASPLPKVKGDRAMLLVLMTNLLENAVKYHQAGVNPHVRVTGEERGSDLLFAVADNGIGIDMKFQNKIFDIFQRLHGESEYPGTGIGLASAKKVVEAHGGRIWFESNAEEGTTFFFALPRRGCEPEAEEVAP
jgi:chemotaxis family two-component system sensor kinase Cph1